MRRLSRTNLRRWLMLVLVASAANRVLDGNDRRFLQRSTSSPRYPPLRPALSGPAAPHGSPAVGRRTLELALSCPFRLPRVEGSPASPQAPPMEAPRHVTRPEDFEDFDNGIGTVPGKVVRFPKLPNPDGRDSGGGTDDLLALVRYCNDLASSHGLVSRCGADPYGRLDPMGWARGVATTAGAADYSIHNKAGRRRRSCSL